MKKLLAEALKQHNRGIRDFVLHPVNQDMLSKVFKDLTRHERVSISTIMFDFDTKESGRFALAIEDHNAIISYRYATEKDFQLPKHVYTEDERWLQLWEELIFEKFEDDSFQILAIDASTMTPQQLCNKYFPTESI